MAKTEVERKPETEPILTREEALRLLQAVEKLAEIAEIWRKKLW